jgi:hypothetical protein
LDGNDGRSFFGFFSSFDVIGEHLRFSPRMVLSSCCGGSFSGGELFVLTSNC